LGHPVEVLFVIM